MIAYVKIQYRRRTNGQTDRIAISVAVLTRDKTTAYLRF